MSEEKKELPGFQLKGNINYEIELFDDKFSFRSQVSNENNLATLLSAKNIFEALMMHQKNPTLAKHQKLKPKEFNEIFIAHKVLDRYAQDLSAAVYQIQLKESEKPKLHIVTDADILKDKGVV